MKASVVAKRGRGPAHRPGTVACPAGPESGSRVAVHQILHAPRPQAKLTVGAPDDAFEREADQVADQVMRMPEPGVQRMCSECEKEEKIQAKEEPGRTPSVPDGFEPCFAAIQGGGQPLPASERAFFEPRFGRDFANVRLHSGTAAGELARSVQARAFTLGDTVVFGAGEHAPGTSAGRRLMAHELTHVVQQGSAAPAAIARTPLAKRAPAPYVARACSPTKISVTNTGNGALSYPLGPILSSSSVKYRYGLQWDVTGDIKDCDLGTKITSLMEDWSSAKVDYYVDIKKVSKADYDSATAAWVQSKETFHVDYDKSELVGANAANFIVESGTTWVKLADGPGGPVASWATGARVRYTVIAWIKGSDGKELSLRFWVSLWATRANPGEAFTVKDLTVFNLPGSVTA